MMQQYFFSAVVPAKSGAQAPAVHAPDPVSSMMQQYFFSAVVPAPVVQSWFSTVHVGVVDDRRRDVGRVGLGVGQRDAVELDRPLDDEARVELDVAELEVAAAPARLARRGAAPRGVAAVARLVLARGVALEALARDRELGRPAPRAVARVAGVAVVDAEGALGDAARVGVEPVAAHLGGAGGGRVLGLAEGRPVHR